jgi:hypothetical protein
VPRFPRSDRMWSQRLLRLCGSRPVVGSSRRGVDQAQRDVQAAALAAGQGLAQPPAQPGELELIGEQLRPLGGLAHGNAVQPGLNLQFLVHQAVRIGAAGGSADGLGDVADPAADAHRVAQQVCPRHRPGPRRRGQQGGQHVQRRRLARAVRPEEADDLAVMHGQVDPSHGLYHAPAAPEGPRETARLDDRHVHPSVADGRRA